MPICNRDHHISLQREPFDFTFGGPIGVVATGQTLVLLQIPYPCSLDLIQLGALGVSGAPTGMFMINRFVVGQGFTAFPVGSTFALTSYSTSGPINATFGVSLPQIGSTLTTLLTNDVLMYQSGGTNAATYSLFGTVILRPIQDIIQYCGIM